MRNAHLHMPYSFQSLCTGAVIILLVTYIGIIAVVMSYAVFTVEFSQSVRNDEATVAVLESRYLSTISRITGTDYVMAGYSKPRVEVFVPAKEVTALR